ncbi:amino acid adenylation domain-containing protein, partial [Streptomyces bohaiensis]
MDSGEAHAGTSNRASGTGHAADGAGHRPDPTEQERPMSFAQRRLWFLDRLGAGGHSDLLPLALRVRGELDEAALLGSLEAVVARHEVLRTRYTAIDGEPVARVAERVTVPVRRPEPRDEDADRAVERLLSEELATPLPLEEGPPIRVVLARLREDEHLVVVSVHHIAFDFASWSVLSAELAAGYRERTGGTPAEPFSRPTQYAEVARTETERLDGPRAARHLAYWRDRLTGLEPLRLPTDLPRPALWDGRADIARFTLDAPLVGTVDALARAHRATRFMVLLAAFQATLGRLSGQRDIAVGVPVSGRDGPELAGAIGLFVNTLVLRTDLGEARTFSELLRLVRADALAAFSRTRTPFERVVTEVAPPRDPSRNPLAQVSFQLITLDEPVERLPGLDVEMVSTPAGGGPFDVALDLLNLPDGTVAGRLQYATSLFTADTARQIGAAFAQLLSLLVAAPEEAVADRAALVPPLPGGERRRLLALHNDTARGVRDVVWTELFAEQAAATPDAVAVTCAGHDISYAELDASSARLANRLRESGVGPGIAVGVLLERGPAVPTTLLAVHRAGGAYLPLDPALPDARLRHIWEDSGARVVITERGLVHRVSGTTATTAGPEAVADDGTRRPASGATAHPGDPLVLLPDEPGEAARTASADPVVPEGGPSADDLAHVFYTSGSTGRPKGALIPHRALTHFLVAMARRLPSGPGDTFAGITTVSFDPSLLELCLPLLTGARLALADREEARDPERMAALIASCGRGVVQATPVTLRMLADTGWTPAPSQTVLSGGEALHEELAARLAADGAQVWDLYGPTETTVWATTARRDRLGRQADWQARDNTVVHVLDDRMEPVPEGATGEVYIGGTGLGWGYVGRPELTAAAFVPDPFGGSGDRLYRTGDLARRRPDGTPALLGRADHQVKIRGHRIEPGEIEAALLADPAVHAATVVALEQGDGTHRLAAYLVPAAGSAPAEATLRAALLRTLPDYMVPEAFVVVPELPRTPNGKVDRRALPPVPVWTAAAGATPPRNDAERAVARVWEEVLGVDGVGAEHDFFQLGGHSLLATRVAVRLRDAAGVDVPVRALFERSTVAALAAALPDYPAVDTRRAVPALGARRRNRRPAAA